jgi:hypothetical protein
VRRARAAAPLALLALLNLPRAALAGSTEPELAIADATASVEDGVVTVRVVANYDHGNAVRLGYPLAVVVTQAAERAQLFLDGRVTVGSGAAPPAARPGAPGVIAVAPTRITAVLPPAFAAAGAATVRLEAEYEGGVLRSNAVEVGW